MASLVCDTWMSNKWCVAPPLQIRVILWKCDTVLKWWNDRILLAKVSVVPSYRHIIPLSFSKNRAVGVIVFLAHLQYQPVTNRWKNWSWFMSPPLISVWGIKKQLETVFLWDCKGVWATWMACFLEAYVNCRVANSAQTSIRLPVNSNSNNWWIIHLLSKKCQTLAGSNFSNCKICCFFSVVYHYKQNILGFLD